MEIEKLLTSPVFRNFPEERLKEFLRSAPAVLRVYSPNDFVARKTLCVIRFIYCTRERYVLIW